MNTINLTPLHLRLTQQQTAFKGSFSPSIKNVLHEITPEQRAALKAISDKIVSECNGASKENSRGLCSKLSLALTSLGLLLYKAIFYKRIKEMERREKMSAEIERMIREIKTVYEHPTFGADFFKKEIEEMNKFVKDNIRSGYYSRFVENATEFLQKNYESYENSGDKDSLFARFRDDKGDYTPRWNKFLWLIQEYAKEAVLYEHGSKYNTERDWYKFEKDMGVACRMMYQDTCRLSDEDLNGDTYPGNIYGFTQETPDIAGGVLRLGIEAKLSEVKDAYEDENGNFDSFKEKVDDLNQYINEHVTDEKYAEFVEKALDFLKDRYKLSQERGDRSLLFAIFMDEEGNYNQKYNEFMNLLKENANDAVR